ncbi:MAG: 3-dehydroquinate synthase [Chitinispirillaceae bacterium]
MITKVELGQRSYPICIDEKEDIRVCLKRMFSGSRFAVVTNDTLASLYAPELERFVKDLNAVTITIPDGEQYKTIDTWRSILDGLLEAKLDRGAVVVAFGGGVVGDITGFAASSFLRGVKYVQVPTTLLSMVDSSVGGKTGVNHAAGKNLIGAFYQPSLVWIDTAFLDTLPERQYVAGYAEVFKNAFIGGAQTAKFIEHNHDALMRSRKEIVQDAIKRSIAIKADVVARDEREGGIRALLNFGHTFSHALEKHYNYTGILHGEGVFWGIACAIRLGLRTGIIPATDMEWYETMLHKLPRPQLPFRPEMDSLFEAMFSDKKVQSGKLRLIVPQAPGTSVIRDDIPNDAVKATFESVMKDACYGQ